MASNNGTSGHGTQEDAVVGGLARILLENKEFSRGLSARTLSPDYIPNLINKRNKDLGDHLKLGEYYLSEGRLYEAQGEFQEASRVSNNKLLPSLRAINSNILMAYTRLMDIMELASTKHEAGAYQPVNPDFQEMRTYL